MANGESRANASLVISMLALLMAVTGVATAGKDNGSVKVPPNSVGSAQLKPGAVKTSDLGKKAVVTSKVAPNTVTSKVLAPDSVTSADMAPGSVQASNLASDSVTMDKIMDGAVNTGKLSDGAVDTNKLKDGSVGTEQLETGAVTSGKIGPRAVDAFKMDTTPGAMVRATSIPMTGGVVVCWATNDVSYSTVERNVSGVFDPAQPQRLTAPISGIYRVTASVKWPQAGGTGRSLWVNKHSGDLPTQPVQWVTSVPVPDTTTDQTVSFDVTLEKDEYLTANLLTCGAGLLSADTSSFSMNWAGPAS